MKWTRLVALCVANRDIESVRLDMMDKAGDYYCDILRIVAYVQRMCKLLDYELNKSIVSESVFFNKLNTDKEYRTWRSRKGKESELIIEE